MRVLVPHNHVVKLTLRHENLVQSSQCLVSLVHDSEHPHPVAFNLLDGIAIESKSLQMFKLLQFLALVQVGDVVAMQVEGFQDWELEDLGIDLGQLVVGEVNPLKVAVVPHHVLEHREETREALELVVLEEERDGLFLDDELLLVLRLSVVRFSG